MKDIFTILQNYMDHATLIRGSKHVAAVVYKGRVLSIGVNSLKTHPIMLQYGKNNESIFLHAEIEAIIRCINNHGLDVLKKSTLYILRNTKAGNVGCSKPCKGCQKAIKAFGIKEVIFS